MDEMLRYYTPVQGLARTAAAKCQFGGTAFDRGDRLFLLFASANRDEEQFEAAAEFRIDRFPNRHLSFGAGIHRCAGSHLATMEFEVMLDEVLSRVPDFDVVESETLKYSSIAINNGYIKMPARFTPGLRLGPRELPGLSSQ
jgi:cytochrome P450